MGSITLSATPGGGVWSSSAPLIATAGTLTGVVTGIAPGTATITYSLGAGCAATKVVSVTPGPSPIAGSSTVCVGSTTPLSDATPGGTWSSSGVTIATVSATGVVTGVSVGVTIISYSVGSCVTTKAMTVNAAPSAIGGTFNICTGATTTYTNTAGGGIWSSSNTSVVSIVAGTGLATGIATGIATISYSTGCGVATHTVTVTPGPAAISGPSSVCIGSTATFTDVTIGGTWSSSAPTVASVGITSGVVTGLSIGSATITYKLFSGCFVTKVISVSASGTAISGPSVVCTGIPTTYHADSVGTWSSSTPVVGTIGATTGVFTGFSLGFTIITFTPSTGCASTLTVTVLPTPAAIVAPSSVCVGNTVTATDATSGGTWSSSNPSVATINITTGVITGVSVGSVTLTYAVGPCSVTKSFTVGAVSAIMGSNMLCAGTTITLTDSASGGTWSSSDTATALINPTTGVVTGIALGWTTISYTIGGCVATKTITVNSNPAPISGGSSVCTGSTIVLTDASPGGTWSSSNPGVATVNTAGLVTGVAAGTATITYTLFSGCKAN